jgi:hypothetical protein
VEKKWRFEALNSVGSLCITLRQSSSQLPQQAKKKNRISIRLPIILQAQRPNFHSYFQPLLTFPQKNEYNPASAMQKVHH